MAVFAFVDCNGFAVITDFEDISVGSGAESASDAEIVIDFCFLWHGTTPLMCLHYNDLRLEYKRQIAPKVLKK